MQIIKPVTVTNSILTSSNVAENDYAEWAVGTTYNVGGKVIVIGTTHRVYESLVGSNLGNDPTTDDGTNWLVLGATNRWKAFDQKIGDPVTNTTTIQYNLSDSASNITSVALFGLKGISANVTVTDTTDGEVYNQTISLIDNRNIVDWYTYFFEEQVQKEQAQWLDIPPYVGSDVQVIVTDNVGDTAQLGQLVLGFLSNLGVTSYGTSISIEDFSRKETDAFGNFIVVERAFSQLADFDVQFETANARKIQRTLAALRATPVVYIGSEDTAYGTTIYGFYRRFDLTLDGPSLSFGAIEVEGLT
tara:strand:+ start:1671 stop:2579 length:909 start_codon:yes stop_codon:yes gene_type:complete